MKLALFSDLHLDINSSGERGLGRDITSEVASYFRTLDADHILIAGDVRETAGKCIEALEYLQEASHKPISFIPGNHDVWTEGQNSWREYQQYREHYTTLIDTPLHLTDTHVVIGDMGWYDYTFGLTEYSLEAFQQRRQENWDTLAKFDRDDVTLTSMMLDKLETQFEAHRDRRVIFLNHFVPYEEFIVRKDGNPEWNFTGGFMGSKRIGELIDRYDNIDYVVFGHTHQRFGTVQTHGRTVICNPLGYLREWSGSDVREELQRATTFIMV